MKGEKEMKNVSLETRVDNTVAASGGMLSGSVSFSYLESRTVKQNWNCSFN